MVYLKLHVNPAVIRRIALKVFTNINYRLRLPEGGHQQICFVRIKDKMASGQPYTTILNTTLMCVSVMYIEKRYHITIGGSISGDDVGLLTNADTQTLIKAFQKVFTSPSDREKGIGNGLVVKFLRVSEYETDFQACSTETFRCPKDGFHVIRFLNRLFYETNCSASCSSLNNIEAGELIESIVYTERLSSQGLPFYTPVIDKYQREAERLISYGKRIGQKSKLANKISCQAGVGHKKQNLPMTEVETEALQYYRNNTPETIEAFHKVKDMVAIVQNMRGYYIDRTNRFCDQCVDAYLNDVSRKTKISVPELKLYNTIMDRQVKAGYANPKYYGDNRDFFFRKILHIYLDALDDHIASQCLQMDALADQVDRRAS